jgi:aminoglycoside 3-N-acetyltransferase
VISAVKSKLLSIVQQRLSQGRRNKLKQWFSSRRKKWARLYVLRYGQYNAKELIGQFESRIGDEFEILMVHSAYDRLLPMYSDKYQSIIAELINLCGRNRTVVMPTFVLGGKSCNPIEFYRGRSFDVNRTPSEMGLLTEFFRRTQGARRSLHPTHSITALGPLAEQLTREHHHAATASGRGTPFEMMAKRKTVIIGLGVEYYRCLTQVHLAEDIVGARFPINFVKEHAPVTIINWAQQTFVYDLTVFKTRNVMNLGLLRNLLSAAELQEWNYKGTALFMTYADKVTNCLVQAANRGVTIYGRN